MTECSWNVMCHIWEKKGFREVRLGLLFVVDGTDTSLEGGKEGKKKKTWLSLKLMLLFLE